MLGHIGLNVPDLRTAKDYYDDVLPLVGFEPYFTAEDQCAYRPRSGKAGTYLFLYEADEPGTYSRRRTGLQHLAFMVPTRSAVQVVHGRIVEHGGEVVHEPQEFPQYPPPYFAFFWLDPFGVMLEAVCHHDRP